MKLLVIENDNYCQDNFEEFIKSLTDLKDITEVIYCYDAKKKPENVVSELKKGVDFITFCPHVIQASQWEMLIIFLAKHKIKSLKEIHIFYPFDDFEKSLMIQINFSLVSKIIEIKEKGIGMFLSRLHFLDKAFCLKKVNIDRLKDRSLLLR